MGKLNKTGIDFYNKNLGWKAETSRSRDNSMEIRFGGAMGFGREE